MDNIGHRHMWHYWPGTDIPIPMGGLNPITVFNTVFVMVMLLGFMWLAVRRRAMIPSRGQLMVEMFVGAFENLVSASLEFEDRAANRRFLPLIASLFLFLLLSNFVGFLPTHYFEEPTADINTTLALGVMGMAIATYCAIKTKGMKGYIEELLGPMWHQPGATGGAMIAGKLSTLFFFPLNIIGELSKVVSISFRIFGNILGGAIIITVVSHLTFYFMFPIGLNLYFVFFVGLVQAFVFTMLTLTYIAVGIK